MYEIWTHFLAWRVEKKFQKSIEMVKKWKKKLQKVVKTVKYR
jgi:hypothetical protein